MADLTLTPEQRKALRGNTMNVFDNPLGLKASVSHKVDNALSHKLKTDTKKKKKKKKKKKISTGIQLLSDRLKGI